MRARVLALFLEPSFSCAWMSVLGVLAMLGESAAPWSIKAPVGIALAIAYLAGHAWFDRRYEVLVRERRGPPGPEKIVDEQHLDRVAAALTTHRGQA